MKLLVALLVAVAAVVGVAAYLVPSNAATVNGTAISRQSLNADLSAIAASPSFQCYLGAQLEVSGQSISGLFPVTGAGKVTKGRNPPTFNNSFVRYWLGKMSDDVLVSQLLATHHVGATQADLAFGRTSLTRQITTVLSQLEQAKGASCGVSPTQVLASLPSSFVDEQVHALANQVALSAHLAGSSLSTDALERYYHLHSAEFDTECISYVAYTSKDAADSARSQIEGGTPIAKTGTPKQIGCGPEIVVTDLPSTVVKLPVGALSQPLSVATGTATKYLLLFVTARNPTPFDKVRTLVAQSLLNSGSSKTTKVLTAAGAKAEVTADPRYGRVRPLSVDLAAPVSPASEFVPDASANLPLAQQLARAAPTPSTGASSAPAAG